MQRFHHAERLDGGEMLRDWRQEAEQLLQIDEREVRDL